LLMTEEPCTWTGITLAGQALTNSVMHGQGYMQGTSGRVIGGYDWGVVANGDSYLSRWTERLDFAKGQVTATWTLVQGTGSLKGITGDAQISCKPPGPTDTVEVCTVSGAYRLP